MNFDKLLPYEAARMVMETYIAYYGKYKRITKRAKIRFEHKDWLGMQTDSTDRITLYRDMISQTTAELLELLQERAHDQQLWLQVKMNFAEEIANFNTRNIAESFYNSVFRHVHKGELGKDDQLMFVHARGNYREFRSRVPIYHTFYLMGSFNLTIQHLLEYYPFDVPYEDKTRDLGYIVRRLQEWADEHAAPGFPVHLEVLKSTFFRNKAAYIVGRLVQHRQPTPFVLAIMHGEKGLVVDTLLLEPDEVNTLFSFTRAYFLVDVDIVAESVDFLRSIIPTKSLGELYNAIGFEKHGKTVFYRDFEHHLQQSMDDFVFTEGIKGMVMTVFTLPSYPMVIKVIKDKFKPPKQVTFEDVIRSYELVNRHDRVGRMADSYLFQQLALPLRRIAPDLLEELKTDCPSRIEIVDDQLILKHCYLEKRMTPLDVYLQKATPTEAREAINEYGKAIKELAAANIFPGDMLLKNFGVTRLNRVVFYDYDEIGFLTDYHFRRIPQPKDPWEELSAEPYYHVGPMDVFPEEFPSFLISNPLHRKFLMELHPDLFDVDFWQRVQALHHEGKIMTVYPYRRRRAFRHAYGGEPRQPYFVDDF